MRRFHHPLPERYSALAEVLQVTTAPANPAAGMESDLEDARSVPAQLTQLYRLMRRSHGSGIDLAERRWKKWINYWSTSGEPPLGHVIR